MTDPPLHRQGRQVHLRADRAGVCLPPLSPARRRTIAPAPNRSPITASNAASTCSWIATTCTSRRSTNSRSSFAAPTPRGRSLCHRQRDCWRPVGELHGRPRDAGTGRGGVGRAVHLVPVAAARDAQLEARIVKRGSIGELVRYFLRLGTIGFGGSVALVGQMERELRANRGWLTRDEMRDAIAISQLGPLATQVGICYLRDWFLGRLDIHPAPLPHRRRTRRAVCAFRRTVVDDRDLLRNVAGGDRADPAFLLAIGEARYGGLLPVADLCSGARHYSGARNRGGDAVYWREHRGHGGRGPGAHRVVASWPMRDVSANFPISFASAQSLLASAFRSPPSLFHYDTTWRALDPARTAFGARTSLLVPELDRLFVAEPAALLESEAAIGVYRPTP
jgi:hypothetical protein